MKLSKFTILDPKLFSFSLSASCELSRNVCCLLFLITNLTDPNAQKFPFERSAKQNVTCRSQSSRFLWCRAADFTFLLSLLKFFSPLFGQLCATWALFWMFLRYIFFISSSLNNTFIENRRGTRHFLSRPRRPCLFTTSTRMLSRDTARFYFKKVWYISVKCLHFLCKLQCL